ncbi:DUF7424 family protein [Pectobacterium polaris]|uniref:DUF7424 family protein n=1 Tax=Pectobacterium polaris TaxID=2042057 RepID=UPI001CF48821|nr:hypothetical protein [Pectobacterium polaris]MCA6954836.1 hypothetical protein [Pectobacterium polaris]
MKKINAILVFSAGLLLSGCKTDLIVPVNLSQLQSKNSSSQNAEINVEVPSCQSYEDSRLESSSLRDAKSEIALILPKSKYIECYKKKMESFARFEMPVSLIAASKDDKLSQDDFYILSQKDIGVELAVRVPEKVKSEIEKSKKRTFGVGGNDFNIIVKLKNDTDEPFKFSPLASFIEDYPIVSSNGYPITIGKGESITIKLSDVSVAASLDKRFKAARVLDTPSKESKS